VVGEVYSATAGPGRPLVYYRRAYGRFDPEEQAPT
jgi:hypothetical protein